MEENLSDLFSLKVKKGEWYRDQNSAYKRIERTFLALHANDIGILVTAGTSLERKEVQMTVIFH